MKPTSACQRPRDRSWRVTTAIRVFVLALAAGHVLSAGSLGSVGVVFAALVLVSAACCVVELHEVRRTPWVPVVEGVLAASLLGTTAGPVEPLLVYLAVPCVVAGVRQGWVTTANTALASAAAMMASWGAAQTLAGTDTPVATSLPWLTIGLGAGLLAAWQTRSVRTLQAAQAPYAAAHRLVGQLHALTHQTPMGLDAASVAGSTADLVRNQAGAVRSAMLVGSPTDGLQFIAGHGPVDSADEHLAGQCVHQGRTMRKAEAIALPLRVGDHVFGAVVLGGRHVTTAQLSDLQHLLDEQALRLETALLFGEVSAIATAEERNRLARDIHDGVAQEIVSLGYLADEIAAIGDPVVQRRADDLRAEITRVVSELRFSIFDLRHDVDEAGSFSGALAEYVREISSRSDLRAHLLLDERGPRLPRGTEAELLRIAQEAIGNVRKHARAINLWVTLSTNDTELCLVVEDDGSGTAAPRAGHYGLHTMRERAARINADLTIGPRADGGTTVTLRSPLHTMITTNESDHHDDQHLARR
ncbi:MULTISPECIES: sensor histidine kinase [unclassified Nocardioides]|uniref:sensor histidine kinase n=1 Tax=unclassified Nocardioides TaxID=2615069 RepID=UPI00361614B1